MVSSTLPTRGKPSAGKPCTNLLKRVLRCSTLTNRNDQSTVRFSRSSVSDSALQLVRQYGSQDRASALEKLSGRVGTLKERYELLKYGVYSGKHF